MRHTKKEIMAGVESRDKGKLIDHNTVEYHRADGTKVVRLHFTDIITLHLDGSITLNSGGWKTVTTKERLNKFSGFSIFQEKNIWYISVVKDFEVVNVVFADGITIFPDGRVKGEGEDPKVYIKLNKDINKYVKGYMTALVNKKIPLPSCGDCWFCFMKDKNGRTMGDMRKFTPGDNNHIISHFKEKYYVPSILTNAMEEFGSSQIMQSCVGYWMGAHDQDMGSYADFVKEQVAKNMKRYLKRRLGMAA